MWAPDVLLVPAPPFLALRRQSSNEQKGQSTNKTISRNESLRCVNALLIPVSKFHPPAVCCPLMRNKTPRSRERGGGGGRWVDALATQQQTALAHVHTHTLALSTRCEGGGCYSRTEARFKPRDSAGLIKEHISICSHSASNQCSLYRLHKTHTHENTITRACFSFPCLSLS